MRKNQFSNTEAAHFNWRIVKEIWPYLLEHKKRVFIAIIFMLLAKLASVCLPFVLKYIVDDIDISQDKPGSLLVLPVALILAYGLVRFSNVLFGEIRDTLFGRVTERAIRRISLKVFQHLHSLDLGFHLNRRTGGVSRDIERGTSAINFLMRFMVFNIVPTLIEISLVIGILFVNYGFGFATITFIAIFIYMGFSVITTEWRTTFIREANKADSASGNHAVDSLLNYETTKYFSNEDFEAKRYDKELAQWEVAKRKNRLSLFALNAGQALIIACAITAMMMLAANNVIEGTMTLGDFVLINAFMMQIFLPLNFLGFVYREMKGSLANIENLFSLLSVKPEIIENKDAKELVVSKGRVDFKNISFSYKAERGIIKNFHFSILPGEKVAVVGASGGGKSTLVKLLFRFYDVDEGSICIDNQDIKCVTLKSLRQAIGIVPQDTVLFNDTILGNVRYGNPDSSDTDVMNAIKMAHLDDLIRSLPDGVNTTVGERGLKLSGGERQRVSIARTILKKPSVLVFDEATSSLDSHSEQAILRALKELSLNATSFVIAHRLSTIIDANRIIVVDNGTIVEQGTHSELLANKSFYNELWKAQQSSEEKKNKHL